MAQVRITRNHGEGSTNGVPHDPEERVYVTGPHFGRDVFSSTLDKDDPEALFEEREAKALIGLGKWRYLRPEIEAADGE